MVFNCNLFHLDTVFHGYGRRDLYYAAGCGLFRLAITVAASVHISNRRSWLPEFGVKFTRYWVRDLSRRRVDAFYVDVRNIGSKALSGSELTVAESSPFKVYWRVFQLLARGLSAFLLSHRLHCPIFSF